MWRACRVAALQHLRTHTTASCTAPISRSIRQYALPAVQHRSARVFSSSTETPLTVSGIALCDLATHSRHELEREFGDRALRAARNALPRTWDNLLLTSNCDEHDDDAAIDSNAAPVSRELATQIFRAALKTQQPELALSVFDYMDAAFPTQVDFVVYGEVFTLLARMGDGNTALAIYERNRPLYAPDRPAPELIYRFGVFGLLGQRDFAGVDLLLDEMQALGRESSNELKSRLMLAYAKSSESERVRAVFESIDPHVGRWHEADVNRVVTSLGLVARADDAFEFYRHAQIKLTGHTLVALLGVCRANNRRRHALAILANRKRFGLALTVREYNSVLETLEALDEHAHIAPLLGEMRAADIPFDKRTRAIVARNQHCLQNTQFEQTQCAATTLQTVAASRREMQMLNRENAFVAAAALADAHVTLVDDDDGLSDNGATTIPSPLAAEAVVAYANSGAHAQVAALVRGFGRVEGDFGHALTAVVSFYSERDHALVYAAFKASLFQHRTIYRVHEALARFREFRDADAALALFHQVFARIAAALEANGRDFVKLKRTLPFDRAHVVQATLLVLLEQRAPLANVIDVLNTLDANGFRVRAGEYTTVFRVMRELGGYSADDIDLIWRDMEARNVEPTRAVVAHTCVALASGSQQQQQRVLDAYARVRDAGDNNSNASDTYQFPAACYTALLGVASARSDVAAVRALFDDAVQSHAAAKRAHRKIKFYPREWVTALVYKLAQTSSSIISSDDAMCTAEADAFALVMAMKTKCGGFAYDAVVAALQLSALVGDREHVARLSAILTRDAALRLRLSDCEKLVQVATERRSLLLAMQAIETFEAGNAVTSPPSTAGASIAAGAVPRALELRKPPSVEKRKDLAAMYAAALTLSEQSTDAAAATAFLQARVREFTETQETHLEQQQQQ